MTLTIPNGFPSPPRVSYPIWDMRCAREVCRVLILLEPPSPTLPPLVPRGEREKNFGSFYPGWRFEDEAYPGLWSCVPFGDFSLLK
jgi:hypothetical protein